MKCHPDGLYESDFEAVYFDKYGEGLKETTGCNISTLAIRLRAMIHHEIDSNGTSRLIPTQALISTRKQSTGRNTRASQNSHSASKKSSISHLHKTYRAAKFTPAMTALMSRLKSHKSTARQIERQTALLNPQDSGTEYSDATLRPPRPAPTPAHVSAGRPGLIDDAWKTRGWTDSSSDPPPPADSPPSPPAARRGLAAAQPPPASARPLELRGGCGAAAASPEVIGGSAAEARGAGAGGEGWGLSGGEEARVAGLSRALARALLAGEQVGARRPAAYALRVGAGAEWRRRGGRLGAGRAAGVAR